MDFYEKDINDIFGIDLEDVSAFLDIKNRISFYAHLRKKVNCILIILVKILVAKV